MTSDMPNPFKIGWPIYKVAMSNKLMPYVNTFIASKGWGDNAVITDEMSSAMYAQHTANVMMIREHG